MTAKEFLERIRKCDTQIDKLTAIKQRMRDRATVITTTISKDGVPGRSGNDRVGCAAVEVADLEHEIDRAVCRYARQMRKAIRLIEQLDNPDHIRLLVMRYIEYAPFDTIAREMGRSVQGIFYMHGRALEAFEQVMNRQKSEKLRKEKKDE